MRKILIIQNHELKISWRNMFSYFVNTSRNTEQLCCFVETALVWLISPAAQTTWTSPRLKMGQLYPAPPTLPTLCVSHAGECHAGHTFEMWPCQDYTSLKPPAVLWQSVACSQQSSGQAYTAMCCSAGCSVRPCWPFEMLGVRWPSDLWADSLRGNGKRHDFRGELQQKSLLFYAKNY